MFCPFEVNRDLIAIRPEDLWHHGAAGSPEGEAAAYWAAAGREGHGASRYGEGHQPHMRGGEGAECPQGTACAGTKQMWWHAVRDELCLFCCSRRLIRLYFYSAITVCNGQWWYTSASQSNVGQHTERQAGAGQSAWRREKVRAQRWMVNDGTKSNWCFPAVPKLTKLLGSSLCLLALTGIKKWISRFMGEVDWWYSC